MFHYSSLAAITAARFSGTRVDSTQRNTMLNFRLGMPFVQRSQFHTNIKIKKIFLHIYIFFRIHFHVSNIYSTQILKTVPFNVFPVHIKRSY